MDRRTLMVTGVASTATRSRTAPRSYTLLVGNRAPIPLGGRPLLLGAGADCDIIIDDARVSRRHAELSVVAEGVRVRDLGSTNGTFWQERRVGEIVVPAGATLRFGDTQVRVMAAQAPAVAPAAATQFGAMVGQSVAMRELFAILALAAPSEATVLIEGESGTGKELAARALHDGSPRAHGPFVVVDCSALSETLIDSHLFGHIRGAFTGADRERKGAFVEASGGTLFLDELGELPLAAQAKLLRAIEAQTVQPVGADRAVSVNTRVVAATHRDLAAMVERQEFRFDLFYRLAVVHVALPPLRERKDDLPLLVAAFFAKRGVDPGPLESANLACLAEHAWPGNVRELRNALERALALAPVGTPFRELRFALGPARAAMATSVGMANAAEGALAVAHPAPAPLVDVTLPFKDAKERWNDTFEEQYVSAVFAAHQRNVSRAAEAAGLSRRHFRELLYKHSVVPRPVAGEREDEKT